MSHSIPRQCQRVLPGVIHPWIDVLIGLIMSYLVGGCFVKFSTPCFHFSVGGLNVTFYCVYTWKHENRVNTEHCSPEVMSKK